MRVIRIVFLFSFGLAHHLLFSQSIRGILMSHDSKEPVPYANIYFRGSKAFLFIGTVSDVSGRFEMKVPKERLSDTLNISCVGFKSLAISFNEINQDTILLNESTTQLPGIVIRPITAGEFIRTCINRIPKNYKGVYFRNIGSSWQSVKIDTTYQNLSLAYVTIEYEYSMNEIKCKVKYDSTSTFSGGMSYEILPTYDSLKEHLYFDLIRTGPGVFNLENFDEWNFEYSYAEDHSFEDVTIVEAKSKGKFVNDFKFFINNEDLAFRKIEYYYHWPGSAEGKPVFLTPRFSQIKNKDSIQYVINDIKGLILYEKTRSKYNLKYMFDEIKYTQYVRNSDLTLPVKSSRVVLKSEVVIAHSKEYYLWDKFQKEGNIQREDFDFIVVNQGKFHEALKQIVKKRYVE